MALYENTKLNRKSRTRDGSRLDQLRQASKDWKKIEEPKQDTKAKG